MDGERGRGFTLIEILVVIAIIVVLAATVFAVGAQSRARARAAVCANQMRQIGMGLGMRAEHGVRRGWADGIRHWNPHLPLLLCPEGPQDGQTNYGVNEYLIGKPAYVRDTGETVLLYESKRAGENLIGDESDVDLRHRGAANFVFLDGHVERLKEIPKFGP